MSSTPGYLPPCFSSSTSLSDRVSSTRVRVGVVDAFRWPPLLAGSDTRRYGDGVYSAQLLRCFSASLLPSLMMMDRVCV